MLEAWATVGIDVGEGVLYFTDLSENTRDRLVTNFHKFDDFIVLDVSLGEALEMYETRIGVSEHSVSIAWDNPPFF